jgi:1-phosphatidylinositol-3-phosphate 5-kinase
MTVRFQADPIGLHEVIYPPMRIRVRPESQLKIKNNDFQRLHRRNVLWYSALIDDLKLINIDAATGDEESDARLTADINILISRAEAEREEIARMINRVYKDSSATDTLALNQVRAFRQDRIVAWQLDFDRLPKPRPLPATVEKNGRKVSAFTSVRAMFPGKGDWASAFENVNVGSASVSEAEDFFWRLKMRRVTGESVNSSASETSEPETGLERRAPEVVQPADDHLEPSGKLDSPSADPAKSDPDSDSTIGAAKDEPMSSPLALQSPASVSAVLYPANCHTLLN